MPTGWHSSALEGRRGAIALNCDRVMEQKTQQEKEEIAFNVQANQEQEQERQEERQERERRKEAEKAELKRCRAE